FSMIWSFSRINRRNGACFSMARTTAHAIITEGEGAFFPFFFLAVSRALRIASQRASICKLAGITWLSLRMIVGERAGAILVYERVSSGAGRVSLRLGTAASTPSPEAFAVA